MAEIGQSQCLQLAWSEIGHIPISDVTEIGQSLLKLSYPISYIAELRAADKYYCLITDCYRYTARKVGHVSATLASLMVSSALFGVHNTLIS